MTDASELLLAARFGALASPLDDSDWLDVRRRAGLDRRSRAWIALPLAAAVAAIAVGSALALYRSSIDFWSSEPAPDRIVVDFGKMKAILGSAGDLVPGDARKITTFVIDGEPRGLFVAPAASGGYCWRLHHIASCGRTPGGSDRFSAGWLESSEHGGPAWISGTFPEDEIRRIEVEYEDGTVARVPFVWVTEPIDAGFLSFDVPPDHLPAGHRARIVRAFDEDGKLVASQEFPFADPRWETGPDGLPRAADRTRKRTLFDFRDHLGIRRTLVVAPAPEEKLCYAYEFEGGCLSPRFPPTVGGMSIDGGKAVDLCCAVSEGVAKVVLQYQDGSRTELEPVGGFLLYVIPPEHYARGHRLERLVWLDAEGREVATRTFDPALAGVYPCAKEDEIDRGYGITTCP